MSGACCHVLHTADSVQSLSQLLFTVSPNMGGGNHQCKRRETPFKWWKETARGPQHHLLNIRALLTRTSRVLLQALGHSRQRHCAAGHFFEMRESVKRVRSCILTARVQSSRRKHAAVVTHFICKTPGFAWNGRRNLLQSSHEVRLRNSRFF